MPRYLKICLLSCFVPLLLLAGFNLAVDPYNIYRVVRSPALDAAKLECNFLLSRVAKAEMLLNNDCEVLVLGSSRVEMGIDPRCQAWGSDEVYNLGISGTCIAESAQVCHYALQTKPLKRVVLFADFDNFAEYNSLPKLEETRFNLQKDAFDYHLGKLLGLKTAMSSLTTFKRYRRGPETTPLTIDRGHLQAIHWEGTYRENFDNFTRLYLRQHYADYIYASRSMQSFGQIVADCRAANVELVVVLSPIHALHLETIHQAGLWSTFERWKQELVQTLVRDQQKHPDLPPIALWDFTGYSPYTCEAVPAADNLSARMQWYLEWSHFSPELGNLVIARIMGRAPEDGRSLDDFGVRIDPGNLVEHLATLRQQRDEYGVSNTEDVQRVELIAHEFGIPSLRR